MMNFRKTIPFSALALLTLVTSDVPAQQQQQGSAAQTKPAAQQASAPVSVTITSETPLAELARAAMRAHGGDRFRDLKNLVLRGSVTLYSPNSTQGLAGQLAIVMAGDKFRMEIQSPAFQMRSIFDGERNYSSMPQFSVPPLSRYGYALLTRFDQGGNQISALPADKDKKRIGFRIAATDGNVTDYHLDPKTGRIARFTIPLEDGVSYGVEHKTFKEIDGVLVPTEFTIKFATPGGIFYAEAKAKTALVNQPLEADVFAIPAG